MSLPRSIHTDTAVGRVIQTRYAGRLFRSRHEAKWAVLFDALGVRWEYEPEGFKLRDGTCYLPDFYIHQWSAWIEVKPMSEHQHADSLTHTLDLVCVITCVRNGFVFFGPPDLIQGSRIVSSCCEYTHVDENGPTHRAPHEGKAYEAYRRAMEERFDGKTS